MPSKNHDAEYWLDRAEEARLPAVGMFDADAKREMLTIAASYGRLAEYARERTARTARQARRV